MTTKNEFVFNAITESNEFLDCDSLEMATEYHDRIEDGSFADEDGVNYQWDALQECQGEYDAKAVAAMLDEAKEEAAK